MERAGAGGRREWQRPYESVMLPRTGGPPREEGRSAGGGSTQTKPKTFWGTGDMEDGFLVAASDTAERLRNKHVRTLEVLQRVVNENERLKAEAAGGGRAAHPAVDPSLLLAQRDAFDAEVRNRRTVAVCLIDSICVWPQLAEVSEKYRMEVGRLSASLEAATSSMALYQRMAEEAKEKLAASKVGIP